MSGSSQHSSVRIVVADPSALGLFGLAMVTLVASSQKLGLTTGLSFVVPWALFLGSMAQLMACVYDFKHGNTFGATAFGAYGLFWAGVAASWLIRMGVFGPELAAEVDPRELGVAFLGYTIFSVYMTIGAMETHKVLFSIFVLIDVLLGALAYNAFYPRAPGCTPWRPGANWPSPCSLSTAPLRRCSITTSAAPSSRWGAPSGGSSESNS